MSSAIKNIAIIGANKEGLKLLPILLKDNKSRVCLIADPNKNAMLFKLNELGYRLGKNLNVRITTDIDEVKRLPDLDIIVNALQDQATERFWKPEFRNVEKLGPFHAPHLGRASAPTGAADRGEQTTLLSSFREIVDAVRLTIDRKELLSVILKLATESTRGKRLHNAISSDEGCSESR
jgi:hypothetical protein